MQVVDAPEVRDDPLRRMHANNQYEREQKHLGEPLESITSR
jgi:hypothetical protein